MENKAFDGLEMKKIDVEECERKREEMENPPPVNEKCSPRQVVIINALLMITVTCIFIGVYVLENNKTQSYLHEITSGRSTHEDLRSTESTGVGKQPTKEHGKEKGEVIRKRTSVSKTTAKPEITTSATTRSTVSTIAKTSKTSSQPHSRTNPYWNKLRLPTIVTPRSYVIELDVDMTTDVYNGTVSIDINVVNETNFVVLHAVDLNVTEVKLVHKQSMDHIDVNGTFFYPTYELFILETSRRLVKGENYKIVISYSGHLRNDLNGFYKSFYKVGNKTKKVASTFFSPISARKAFPCFDEPAFKANITLILTHSDTYTSQSNMPAKSTCRQNGKLRTEFQTSIVMSTYIVCWVISEYDKLQTNNGIISAWADDVNDVRFGLETSTKLLHFYEGYFKIPYPLKKLDLISIPSFGPGAMENWGLITFRSERILINEKYATNIDRQKSFHLIAHELSHQWFGNLVTMEFWTDAWLKEGFANNFGALGGDAVDKKMGSKERVLSTFMLPALELDSYASSHPISIKVSTPNDIRQVFDIITYNKGSCLVSLLRTFLGEKNFQKGIQSYLKKYSYKNANQDELWEELGKVSSKDVKSVMDTWTLQQGYPLITVQRLNKTSVSVRQEKFSLDYPNVQQPKSRFGYIWKVPLMFKDLASNMTIMYLFESKEAVLTVPDEFTIVNPDHAMFYRVHYKGTMFAFVVKTLLSDHQLLSAQDRTGFVSDQFSLVSGKITTIGRTLEIIKYMKFESDYYVWKTGLDHLNYISSLITNKTLAADFNSYTHSLIANLARTIGWGATETTNEELLQTLVLKQACMLGHEKVIEQSKTYYLNWAFSKLSGLKTSLYPVFRDCAISQGSDFFWEYAYLQYKRNNIDDILWSLTATKNIKTIQRLLNYSLDANKIDSQYTPYVISDLAKQSYETRLLCWNYIKNNWSVLHKRYSTSLFMFSDLLKPVLEGFSTTTDLDDIKLFFKKRNAGSASKAVEQAIQKIEGNIIWKENNIKDLETFLAK